MITLPKSIENRKEIDNRLGIKSSLNDLSSVIALSYILYVENSRRSTVDYSDESIKSGKKEIVLKVELESSISEQYGIDKETLNNNPLFKSQLEALQVGLSLMFKIGKINFIEFPNSDTKERSGGERYRKLISFSTNIKIIDLYISSWAKETQKEELKLWLSNKPSNSPFSEGLRSLLTVFSEDTIFKLRDGNQEVIFQQEGIYSEIINGNSVLAKDSIEDVGPFRVFKSFVKEGLHSYLQYKSSNEFVLKQGVSIEEYNSLVQIGLSLNPKIVKNIEVDSKQLNSRNLNTNQIIYYGAPGTGKSCGIKRALANNNVAENNIFRTTFHPDSDYSTFVGAYKPTMERVEKVLNKQELFNELSENSGSYVLHKFAAKFWRSLKKLTRPEIKDILEKCSFNETYLPEIAKGIAVGEELSHQSCDARIAYNFIPQAFLNAYVRAYQTDENVYLVIEEINRGNCAQIFGDLFQLLDRGDDGKSEYSIKADTDIRTYLEGVLGDDNEGIKGGNLCLPANLYILATMNTSDQSLFPIDSAFKRRWEWEYVPIRNEGKGWVIAADGKEWDWWQFLEAVNEKIASVTDSEDKKLGYYFVKPADGHTITAKTFVGKVLFYLWNDVFKDYGFSDDEFQTEDGKEIRYPMFYETVVAGQEVNEGLIAQFLNKLLPKPEETDEATNTTTQEEV